MVVILLGLRWWSYCWVSDGGHTDGCQIVVILMGVRLSSYCWYCWVSDGGHTDGCQMVVLLLDGIQLGGKART